MHEHERHRSGQCSSNRSEQIETKTSKHPLKQSTWLLEDGKPLMKLNELEYIKGEIFANIWQTDRIAKIDPQTGRVTGWVNLAGLLAPADRTQSVDVLNGIAYDESGDRLFVTGKWWPKLFEIRLVTRRDPPSR